MATRWSEREVPDQDGRTAVITGANSGLGFETARILARRNMVVVLACRDIGKADEARDRILAEAPTASVRTLGLDLCSQASVRRAAVRIMRDHARVDLLINNAGAVIRRREVTEDGFEKTLATNHLGAFAFTGQIMERLLNTPGSRVVTVSSVGHKRGVMNFDDLHFAHGYRFNHAYFQSKLANLLFTYELQRRLAAVGAPTIAVAAHPGNARTAFGADQLPIRIFTSPRLRLLTWWMLQDSTTAALSIVRAAVDPAATGGQYYGPDGRNEWTGHPVQVQSIPQSHDANAQQRLWELSEQMTGVSYPLGDRPTAPGAHHATAM
ncbi:SDR family NAD(P)-dependent oxidoreductase [Nocardia sp. NEAU-G5]|uniref:SDR family NAD(P)-dependent oxidoreductase n=1 Tax=Nocardia albiluteola TaxID=2842303 RepID=A0ABS6B8R3_9NOCA|nr:oxidoreductase [Nocardia albiluteola]MBU3066682.1 SDR family NAD(P)-dependent oxidoreductase [Nocardia albiluteola]